eukprot:5147813-Pleurochrysis_carterae.AAC.1
MISFPHSIQRLTVSNTQTIYAAQIQFEHHPTSSSSSQCGSLTWQVIPSSWNALGGRHLGSPLEA